MNVLASLSLLPSSLLESEAFGVLAAFVAINTLMYAAVTVAKLLPRVHPSFHRTRHYERSETRSIFPDGPR